MAVNSLYPGKCGCDFKCVNFKHNMGILRSWLVKWTSPKRDCQIIKSASIQVMAWCSTFISVDLLVLIPYEVIRPQGVYFACVVSKYIVGIDISSISCEVTLTWIQQDVIDKKSTSVQVMAWCYPAMSHSLPELVLTNFHKDTCK